MNTHIEYEHKYLVEKDSVKLLWDKKVVVYQFFEKKEADYNVQLKIIIDLKESTVKYARVIKRILSSNKSIKEVEYMDRNNIIIESLVGVPFVLKKRLISKPYFLDKYIIPPMYNTDLLEIEYEDEYSDSPNEVEVIKRVTGEKEYMNENMARPFKNEDKRALEYLLNIVCI